MEQKITVKELLRNIIDLTASMTNTELGIFMRLSERILSREKDNYSFPDDIRSWMYMTGLNNSSQVKSIREKFIDKNVVSCNLNHNLTRVAVLSDNFLCNSTGLDADATTASCLDLTSSFFTFYKKKRRRPGASGAGVQLARARARKKSPPLFVEEETGSDSIKNSKNSSPLDLNTISILGARAKKEITALLGGVLEENQIDKVLRLCPGITTEYITQKLDLLKARKPKNGAAFLYAALTQNFSPAETPGAGKKSEGPGSTELMEISVKRPLSREEFEKLPADLRGDFKEVEHVMPNYSIYALKSKPKGKLNSITAAIFNNMDIGDKLFAEEYGKLAKKLQRHFTEERVPMGAVKKYHRR